eukprot:s4177_g3.t1
MAVALVGVSSVHELHGILADWLEDMPPPGRPLPALPTSARRVAWRFARNAAGCSVLERGVARLVASGLIPTGAWYISLVDHNVSAWRKDLWRLRRMLDWSLQAVTWNRLLFSSWPLPAILHRLQEAYLREAVCSAAAEGGYALRSRAESSPGVWLCIGRMEDLAAERWRMHGEFSDCTAIARLLRGGSADGCLFADDGATARKPTTRPRMRETRGANLGSCSLQIAREGFAVLALEPSPATAALLKASVLRNGLESRIEVVQAAAGRGGVGRLRCPEKHSAACTVEVVDTGDEGQLVSTVALDALLQKRPRLCALKIDVEGSEEEALMGAWQSLHLQPRLFLEIHAGQLRERGTSSGSVFDRLLIELGYRDVKLLSDHESNCFSASGSRSRSTPQGDGVHAECRWHRANLLPAGLYIERDACRCARACFLQIRPGEHGCRCWDFDAESGHCQMYRSCEAVNATALAPRDRSWAGELSGNFVFS